MIKLYLLCGFLAGSHAFIPTYLNPSQPELPQSAGNFRLQRNPTNGFSVEDSLDAGYAQTFLQRPQFEQDTTDDCQSMPNATKYRPAFYQCGDEESVVTLHGGAVTNITGDDNYPVAFHGPIRIFLDLSSDSNRRFDDLGVEVSLYKRSTGWFGCGWMFMPSFGMLSNYDVCDDNPSCPLSPGRQVLEFAIDPTRLFTRIFRMIHDDMSAYQLVLRLRDNRSPLEELLCATIQMRVRM